MESKLAPAGDVLGAIPSGGARRAYKDTLERSNHRVAIEGEGGFRERRQTILQARAEVILSEEALWSQMMRMFWTSILTLLCLCENFFLRRSEFDAIVSLWH